MKKIRLTEKQLKDIIMSEVDSHMGQETLGNDYHDRGDRYMFFSNLEQMRRQCDMLLDLDHNMIEEILDNGHDWAQDHIAEAKNNMDQVFDFLMNETKRDTMNEKWSQKYKKSIDCTNPKGFSQRAHCQGRKK
jgi:hypothetical protein